MCMWLSSIDHLLLSADINQERSRAIYVASPKVPRACRKRTTLAPHLTSPHFTLSIQTCETRIIKNIIITRCVRAHLNEDCRGSGYILKCINVAPSIRRRNRKSSRKTTTMGEKKEEEANAHPASISALQEFITTANPKASTTASTTAEAESPYQHLALQIAHNLRYQHGWTDVRLHHHHHQQQTPPRSRPLLLSLIHI